MSKAKDKSNLLQFPIPLEDVPPLKSGQTSEKFVDFYGTEYTFITGMTPIEFSINTWIPKTGTKYPFQLVSNPNPFDYTEFLYTAMYNREPINITICDNSGVVFVSGVYSIGSFEDGKNKFGDTTIAIDCKHWEAY